MKVDYQKDRIRVDGQTLDKRLREKLLRTKYESWCYEKEWRVQVPLNKAHKEGQVYFERIGEHIHLAEVVLGPLCITSADEVRRLVDTHHQNVDTFQARLASGSFHIVPNERTIPAEPRFEHVR
jgi:hypothetical protein